MKAALAKAKKGAVWTGPRGIKRTPIAIDTGVVGILRYDADLTRPGVGSYWAGPFGRRYSAG